jgi:hypothetical protein
MVVSSLAPGQEVSARRRDKTCQGQNESHARDDVLAEQPTLRTQQAPRPRQGSDRLREALRLMRLSVVLLLTRVYRCG